MVALAGAHYLLAAQTITPRLNRPSTDYMKRKIMRILKRGVTHRISAALLTMRSPPTIGLFAARAEHAASFGEKSCLESMRPSTSLHYPLRIYLSSA
jgi:hypothetical protein